jgi:cell shape-determining protein MreD
MRWVWVAFLTIVAAVLQVSLMGALRIGGVVPNLVLILVVCLVAWGTASEALVSAVVGGLILDVSGAGTFGLATSSLVVICLALVALRQLGVDGHAWPARLGMVAAASFAWGIIHVAAIGASSLLLAAAWRIILLEVMVNCLIALLYRERLIRGTRTI